EENFYQLVYQPDFTDDLYSPRHVLVLMDYQINNSDIDKTEMIEMVKNQLHSELNANDFFNVIANDVPIYTANNNWISATDTNIDETLNNAAEQLVQYSSLPNLLFEGISYAQQNDGSVLLIANSGNLWELETANSLLDDLNVLLDEKEVPIHVADYHNRNLRFSHFGNQQFAGNQYLYSRLTGRTGGEFTHLYYQHNGQNVYTNQLRSVLQQMQNINANFDLHTDVTNGFCYARYNFNNGNVINRPFMQMGKFSGEFPFQIELAGTFDGQLFNEETSVNTALDADPTLIQSWTGQWIREQELLNQNTNSSINEVIDVSLDERVLSYFTAFLALEPNQGGEICQSCDNPDINTGGGDGGECCILAVDDISLKGISELKAAPNPFTQQTTVQLKLGNDWKDSRAQIRIFNQLGQLVYSFTEQELKAGEEYEFTWNATDLNGQPLPKGIYFFQIQTEGGTQVVKLVFQ
ncbi:MAG: T9SS type A sorting domain-containing protein, partial [Saprospiraceae bacterium]